MLFKRLIVTILLCLLIFVFGLLTVLLMTSFDFWSGSGFSSLIKTDWYPYEHLFGLLPAIIGSLISVSLALLFAVPTSLAAAIFSYEVLSKPQQQSLALMMQLLAGMPSIVYGLIGLWVLLPLLQSNLHLLSGHSLLAAGMILCLMIMPSMMLMMSDAIAGVDHEQCEAGKSLGLQQNQLLYRIVLPQAHTGIRSAILLSTGRALGETMAVMLLVGSMNRLPQSLADLLQPAQTLTSLIGREIGESAFGSLHFSALMACGLLLALMASSLSLFAQTRTQA